MIHQKVVTLTDFDVTHLLFHDKELEPLSYARFRPVPFCQGGHHLKNVLEKLCYDSKADFKEGYAPEDAQ